MNNRVLTSEEILDRIEDIVVEKSLSYMEATTHFCELTGMEIEAVAEVIRRAPRFKAKIKSIAEELNMLKHPRARLRL